VVKRQLARLPCLKPFLNNGTDFLGCQFQAAQRHKKIILVSGAKKQLPKPEKGPSADEAPRIYKLDE
jgi:hypothetical protein